MTYSELCSQSDYRRFLIVRKSIIILKDDNLFASSAINDVLNDFEEDNHHNNIMEKKEVANYARQSPKYYPPTYYHYVDKATSNEEDTIPLISYLLSTVLLQLKKDIDIIRKYFRENAIKDIFDGKIDLLKFDKKTAQHISFNIYVKCNLKDGYYKNLTKNNFINHMGSAGKRNRYAKWILKTLLNCSVELNEYLQKILLQPRYYFMINYTIKSDEKNKMINFQFITMMKPIFVLLIGYNQPKSLFYKLKSYPLFDPNILRLICNLAG